MGLDINIKGLEREDTYHAGYITFNLYIDAGTTKIITPTSLFFNEIKVWYL